MHLHRSFKPAECKTQLGLAMSRLKVMKNKKVSMVNQLKREVAQLLESGQDQTARIRVEHVIREEKIMFAYDLLDVYCELIVTRLQIIESQKICPTDLKEAISSVIYASPRCADVPELVKVRKHFLSKYGKEFVNSVLELRPNCGVTPLLIDKLSAKAPDIKTKVKVLTSIASENSIKWEPKSFEESLQRPNEGLSSSFERSSTFTTDTSKPEVVDQQNSQKRESAKSTLANEVMNTTASDLAFGTKLQGPTSFESASSLARESTKPEFISQSSKKHEAEKEPLVNEFEDSIKSSESISAGSTNIAFTQSPPERIPPEQSREGQEIGISYSREDVTVARQPNWGIDFKDAASAAQAAAESAERASMAARVAAELAARENGPIPQCSAHDERPPEQVQMPINGTEDMHRMNSGSKDQWKDGAMQGRSERTYSTHGSEKDRSRRITSSPVSLDDHHETSDDIFVGAEARKNYWNKKENRMNDYVHEEMEMESRYPSYSHKFSYDGKRFVEGTEKAHIVERTSGSDSRQHSFDGDSGPTFDGDSSYNGVYVDFDDLGNNEESPSFQYQGSRSSDFSSYVDPRPKQQKDESPSNSNSSLLTHSMKKRYVDENADNTRKDALPLPSSNVLPPLYDSEPEESGEVDFTGLLSHQTEKDSTHSENPDYSNYEGEPVLKMEKLTGGFRNRGFPRPPYIVSSLEEGPVASRETPSTASSRIKKPEHSISNTEVGDGKVYNQKQRKKPYVQKMSSVSSSDSDSSEGEVLQPNNSPTVSEKGKFDPSIYATSQESSYRRSLREASEESTRTATVVNSDIDRRARRVNPSFLSHEIPDDIAPATEAASVPIRHKKTPKYESFKQEVLDEEPRVKEMGPRRSTLYSSSSNGDGDDSQSYQSYARSGTKDIIKQSRRTRASSTESKISLLSKAPDRTDVPLIQRKSQEDILDKMGNSKFLPLKSQTERPSVTHSLRKESARRGTSSESREGLRSFGLKSSEKSGTKPVSTFGPPASWKKNMSDEEDFEALSQNSDEDSELSQRDLMQTAYSGRTQRPKSPASTSSEYTKKVAPPISSPSDFARTSSLEIVTPKATTSTSSESSKKVTTSKPSQGDLERNLSIENKDQAKHIHPKLPDSDKLMAHFQALRSNVRK